MEENKKEEGLSLIDIWHIIKKYWIGLVCIIAGFIAVGAIGSVCLIPKKYQVNKQIYIQYNKDSNSEMTDSDIVMSLRLVNTAINYLSEPNIFKATSEKLQEKEIDIDYKVLSRGFTFKTSTNSLCIETSYVSGNKDNIITIMNTYLNEVVTYANTDEEFKMFKDVISYPGEMGENDIYDVSTSKALVTSIFGVVGVVVGLCYEFIANSLDRTIKSKDVIESDYNIRVIGMIPDAAMKRGSKNEK